MSEINAKLLEFLQSHIDLIESQDWETLYRKVRAEAGRGSERGSSKLPGQLTQLLYQADINPLATLSYIPEGFLTQADIESFYIPSHIKIIGSGAFQGCEKLTSLTIPTSVGLIESWAISGCDSLKSLDIPGSVAILESQAAAYNPLLKELTLHEGLSHIDLRAFAEDYSLIDIRLPDSVTVLGDEAFNACRNLGSFEFGGGITVVGKDVITGCRQLMEVSYRGTIDQWLDIEIAQQNARLRNIPVICTDGTIQYNNYTGEWEIA